MYKVFQSHRSIRRFKPIDLPEEHVHLILEAGRRAPTDATLHLWSAIRLDRELRKRIAELIGQQHVDEAGLFLVFIADLYRLERLLEYRGVEMGCVDTALLLFAAIDAALAAENMAVMAEALGYGTCFIGGIQNAVEEIIKILKLPHRTFPLFGLAIGVPAEDPPIRPRLPLRMLVHDNYYRDYTDTELEEAFRVMAPISRRGDWLRILVRYVGKEGYFVERSRMLYRVLEKQGFRLECGREA